MKTNPPLSRERLLRTIDQCAPPEAVVDDRSIQRIMNALSGDQNESIELDESVTTRPIPLMDVAAYVDGTLKQQDQLDRITSAAVVDPGLLMEIVLARRAEAQDQPSQQAVLGGDLRDRLLAMHSAVSITDRGPVSTQPPNVKKRTDDQETMLPVIEPSVTKVPTEIDNQPGDADRSIFRWAIAVAAVLMLAVGTWIFAHRDDQSTAIVDATDPTNEEPGKVPSLQDPFDSVPTESGDGAKLLDSPEPPMLAEQPSEGGPGTLDEIRKADRQPEGMQSESALASDSSSVVGSQPRNAVVERAMAPSVVARDDSPAGTDVPGPLESLPRQPKPSQLVATWSQIDGLLVRSDSSGSDMTSTSGAPPMESITKGSSFKLAGESLQAPLRLRTLPLCRAVADLDGGGQLVVASDTLVEAGAGGTLHLQYGSIALLDVNDRSTIRLGQSTRNSVAVSSRESGSLVVRRTRTGLEIDAANKSVMVNGESFSNMTVRVDDKTMVAEPVGKSPERLPKWTRQRVDRIELGRNVLAQLASSNDIRTSLATALVAQDTRSRGAETLRTWLVEASSDSLLRLVSSGDSMLRERALNYMRSVTPDNPKHGMIWRGMAARSRNPRTLVTMRAFFVNLWSNERPIQARREQLLRLLQAADPASRATADYLLRAFYGPGPAFDMNANAQVRTRTINAWRTVINRVDG